MYITNVLISTYVPKVRNKKSKMKQNKAKGNIDTVQKQIVSMRQKLILAHCVHSTHIHTCECFISQIVIAFMGNTTTTTTAKG